jgi:long-chain acyl-CoA synthetase
MTSGSSVEAAPVARVPTFWRVEGSLLDVACARPLAFFCWNSQSFVERWARRLLLALLGLAGALVHPLSPRSGVRLLHLALRGVSRDRLDLLGEEYVEYVLRRRIRPEALAAAQEAVARGERVVLVTHHLEHLARPLARLVGAAGFIANRFDFRDGLSTGRLEAPIVPRTIWLSRLLPPRIDGRLDPVRLARRLGVGEPALETLVRPTARPVPPRRPPIVRFGDRPAPERLSVREAFAGRRVLLVGASGFIGKVWLRKILDDVPEIGRLYVLMRPQRNLSGPRRFERILGESPVFEDLRERHGAELPAVVGRIVEVIEGDISRPGLGLDPAVAARLRDEGLDLIVNSSGLTEFNPDLRLALAINVEGTLNVLELARRGGARLLQLSTCYVAGFRDGRIPEAVVPGYTPAGVPGFDAEAELAALVATVAEIERRAAAEEAEGEGAAARLRARRVREQLVEAGMRRARELGWPNTYTLTKSLAESLLLARRGDVPVAIVRPSIVESSLAEPFRGWNEGINTSAPISYLLGTYFRQLPSDERKPLDIIPVDLVCRGMLLVGAALLRGVHEPVYQLATSAANLCDMRRSVELTGLAHRKHYRAQKRLELQVRARLDPIPVSKRRYERFSAPGQRALIRRLRRLAGWARLVREGLGYWERELDRVERIIELYEPFVLHNQQVFEADHVEWLARALPEEERAAFGYDVSRIDWWDYWINLHIPALRRWSYPLIEGRPIRARTRRDVPPAAEPSADLALKQAEAL